MKKKKLKKKNEIQNEIKQEQAEKKKKKKKRIEKRKIKLEDEKNKEDSMWERLHVLNTQINVSCQKMSDSVFFLLLANKLHEKENTKKLKNFPAGYVGSFYRNLADNINTNSHFYLQIAADGDIPKDDVQKYILATTDFAKSIKTDINHDVRDRINNESFRQRLDPISKNILRRQNPLELVFEDISTFDAEN